MFPLTDTEHNRYDDLPLMTLALIVVNIIVTAYELSLPGDEVMVLFNAFGSRPQLVLTMQGAGALASITHMFLHGGLMHLISNMWALWVFGCRVEDACGHWRFLIYYLVCGLIADTVSTLIRAESSIPGIGASGAIFGVMGAYLILYPGGRIRTFIMLWFVPMFPKIRAFWIILYFLAIQIVPAMMALRAQEDYGVNYWAHLGGFFSCLLIFLFLRPEAFARYWAGEPI